MKVGMVGLGKLGFPVAMAMDLSGHHVYGYDVDDKRMTKEQKFHEVGPNGDNFDDILATSDIDFVNLETLVRESELIFIAVQTPHQKEFEGDTPLPTGRADFDYTYLVDAVKRIERYVQAINEELKHAGEQATMRDVVIISTVLPGTIRREVLPVCPHLRIAYNPYFTAMGTVMPDFFNPEFVLIGTDNPGLFHKMRHFYRNTVHGVRCDIQPMGIESAECAKVLYNTFIGMKIVFANTMMEICEKVPEADHDEVYRTLMCATDRLISTAYLRGGMGDGGGCHPRDNIALSWFAREVKLSADFFTMIMQTRERQSKWLADMAIKYSLENKIRHIVVLGTAFKKGTAMETGSSAILLYHQLVDAAQSHRGRGLEIDRWDPKIDTAKEFSAAVFVIGCNHEELTSFPFPEGSIVIDPWRMIPDSDGITVKRIGQRE